MKLKNLLKESQHLDYRRMNVGEEETKGMTNEEKKAFLEAVSAYRQLGEMISHKGDLREIHESIKKIVENANSLTLKETGDWFDKVTVNRHMKSMNESYKIFSTSIKEVVTLQQRMESAYDEIGEVLGKYYEIKEGNEFGAERAKAIAAGEDEFEVDGKKYKVTSVDADDKENAKKFTNEAKVIVHNEKTGERYEVLSGKGKGDLLIAMNALQKAAPKHMKYSLKENAKKSANESMKLTNLVKEEIFTIAGGVALGLIGTMALIKGAKYVGKVLGGAAEDLVDKLDAKSAAARVAKKRQEVFSNISPILKKFENDSKLQSMYNSLPPYRYGTSDEANRLRSLRNKKLKEISDYIKSKLTAEEQQYFADVSKQLRGQA